MSNIRFKAIFQSSEHKVHPMVETTKRSEAFGVNVFNNDRMMQYLTKDAMESVKNAVQTGSKIDRKMADQIAESMKAWAMSMGATHYTHWFQPLTGATAEKHDAFFDLLPNGKAMEKFGGVSWCNKNPMPPAFPVEGYAIPSKPEAIQPGILLPRHSFMEPHYVSQRFLFPIQEKR